MSVDAWGIQEGYFDAAGTWRPLPDSTREVLREAMGGDSPDAIGGTEVRVIRRGEPARLAAPAELILEDGTRLIVDGPLPPDLPLGYHLVRPRDSAAETRLIVAPRSCFLPPELQTWGWAVQLYALRSASSWGIGDLGDLARLADWSADELGAGVVLVNPLHAALPLVPQQPSPYYPSSRRFRNPLYLRVEDVPGAAAAGPELESLASAGRALDHDRRIDRDAVFGLKMSALERIWDRFPGDPAFERYRAEIGPSLRDFATFCVLAEFHGSGWHLWPEEHRTPRSGAVARFAADHAARVGFHEWLQWLLDAQIARAGRGLALVHDLAIGVDPDGADAWSWQGVLAEGVTVGAPPDEFNAVGQDWGFPPFIPHRLKAAGYRPFIETMRASLRHAGGLRIDHVMGLFRLFWVPRGLGPLGGAYVRYPADDLLAIVALESQRARAFIVGEDLGTVEPAVREELAARDVLSYRLLWFEPGAPPGYPARALSAITTHDLPTIAGLWTGADLAAQKAIGLQPNVEGTAALRARLAALTGLDDTADLGRVIVRAHEALAEAPSAILTATLDDALAVPERPNVPGTIDEWPNWSLALPVPLEALVTASLPRKVADALRRRAGR